MNRFEGSSSEKKHRIPYLFPVIAFLVIFVCFLYGVQTVNDTAYTKQKEGLETALFRCISQCYAVEGAYPPSLDYLKEHYGLTYDENTFLIDYEYYGGNLLPEVTVLYRQNSSAQGR